MLAIIQTTLDSLDDRKFMSELYEEYHLLMFSEANKFCPRQEDREDLVQNSLVRLMKNISTLRSLNRCTMVSYLVITIRNTFYTQFKREKRAPVNISIDDLTEAEAVAEDNFTLELIKHLDHKILLDQLWECVSETDRFLLEGNSGYYYRIHCSANVYDANGALLGINTKTSSTVYY